MLLSSELSVVYTLLRTLANSENQGPEEDDEWPEICEEDDDGDDDEKSGAVETDY